MSLTALKIENRPRYDLDLDPVIRLKAFLRLTGLGRSTVYKMIANGTIERPFKVSARVIGWRASTVKSFLDLRMTDGGQQS